MLSQQSKILVHFIGIGGIGMSGIAEILISLGYNVSGSDAADSANVEKLRSMGATIHIGHAKENLSEQVTVVVYSSAVKDSNPEIIEAKSKQIPIMRRAEMLAELMRLKRGIAVAGTHGKTTTTSMLATILQECGVDPTYIIGGIVNNLSGHAKVGEGQYLVAEADESDGTFLLLNPIMSVITNVDNDHLDHYGSSEKLVEAFEQFANRIPFYGKCVLNAHDATLMTIAKNMKKPWSTFSISDEGVSADFEAHHLVHQVSGCHYQLRVNGIDCGTVHIALPGRHNVLNSLGAIALAHQMGLQLEQIIAGIAKFEGVGRRMQKILQTPGLEVIDDYAHHPTEIATTLQAIRQTRGDRQIIVIFEPHRFSRTRDCWKDFLHCFNQAHQLLLCPIYPASELPIPGITAEKLVEDINQLHPQFAQMLGGLDQIESILRQTSSSPRTVVCLGAGAISRRAREAVARLS